MAETPNIASILAALAAQSGQRPASNPAQPQRYTQPAQQAPPSYPVQGAYSLPQPISSGSVDLNNIKPVSSGTVMLNDAIAKAKAIAAEKGISYDRPPQAYGAIDLRAENRQYSQGRSRSRSPPPGRRDAFRDNYNPGDNYNPYRDERRGDRGHSNREFGRERSRSPVNRGRGPPGTFSPARGGGYSGRERSPMGRGGSGDGDGFEALNIDSNLVGLIIGRAGENLRRVEKETGCRVQFITNIDDTSPTRQCKISGPRARRAEAKAEINRIIEDSGMGGSARPVREPAPFARESSNTPVAKAGENTVKIMVPDRTVGLIIGRGGETIRDLQERSGCHVNIVGEQKSVNGLRPVNLIGTKEASARAKALIMEIVDSDSTKGLNKDKPANPQVDQFGGDKIHDNIFVPSEAVGMIIGKGGETIKEMQNITACKINVTPSSGSGETEREIGLVGSRNAISQAKAAIMEKVDAVRQKNGGRSGGNRGNNDYGDRNYSQQQYGQPQGQAAPAAAAAVAAAPGGAEADPYAPYGGYQGYLAMWYMMQQAQQQQQGGAPPSGDQPKPPGTS